MSSDADSGTPGMSELEGPVARALAAARWFAGKATGIDRVRLHDRVPLPGAGGAEVLLVEVHAAGGSAPDRYVMVRRGSDDDAGSDNVAGNDNVNGNDAAAALARWLAAAIGAPVVLAGQAGRLVVHATAGTAPGEPRTGGVASARAAAAPSAEIVPLGDDASNSSFLVPTAAGGLTVKLVRRCRTGIQPEVEVGEFLARECGGWRETPRLRGWLEYVEDRPSPEPSASTAIATVHEFAPRCTTAWERLSGLLAAAAPGDDAVAPLLQFVARIGAATARMHEALAARPGIAAFAPRPASAAGRRSLAADMATHALEVFARVEREAARQPAAVAARLRAVLAARSRIVGRFERLARVAATTPDIRVHGDYHLGQVLVGDADDRVLVIDFEGEPGRPLALRRATWSAAKDVAGMCRSFDYLLRQAAKTGGPPYDAAALERLERCFLDAYRAAAAGGSWWPAAAAEAEALLEAFRLDKAIYELAYELDNRPDWIDVPLAAVEAAASPPDGTADGTA